MKLGFVGLGVMGFPMALNLVRAGVDVLAWSRSGRNYDAFEAVGGNIAASSSQVFRDSDVVILMLVDARATDEVLQRNTPHFATNVAKKIVVSMGTTSAEYSQGLGEDIEKAGGRYVEAPVSGSRKPAEQGLLVGMLAGRPTDVAVVAELLKPICHKTFVCGAVPSALLMKLSVNLFLITMVTGLAEATHFASRHELDTQLFRSILDAGPMASSVSTAKLAKLVSRDFEVQASIHDVLKNNRLVAEAARMAAIASPLLDVCHELFRETADLGHGSEDMVAVVKAIEFRTSTL